MRKKEIDPRQSDWREGFDAGARVVLDIALQGLTSVVLSLDKCQTEAIRGCFGPDTKEAREVLAYVRGVEDARARIEAWERSFERTVTELRRNPFADRFDHIWVNRMAELQEN